MRTTAKIILWVTICILAIVTLGLSTIGRDSCTQLVASVAEFHPATDLLAIGLAQVGSTSVGDIPSWAEAQRDDINKIATAVAAGDLESSLARLVALNGDVKRAGHNLNELGKVLIAQLVPAVLAGFLAGGGLVPLAVVIFGGALLGLAGRLGVSPLGLLKGWPFFILAGIASVVVTIAFVPQPISAAGLLVALATGALMILLRAFVPVAITILLVSVGIAGRVWLGSYPELLAFLTEGLLWFSLFLVIGLFFSLAKKKEPVVVQAQPAATAPAQQPAATGRR